MREPKSTRMEDKPEFRQSFERCDSHLQQIFIQVRDNALSQCVGTDYGYTDKPDFRFSLAPTGSRRWETYAELFFRDNLLFCNLRIDGMNREELQNSVTINFHQTPSRSQRQGEDLVSFTISGNQVADAVSLIFQVFDYQSVNG